MISTGNDKKTIPLCHFLLVLFSAIHCANHVAQRNLILMIKQDPTLT